MKLAYAVFIEKTPNNCAAYAPEMPGCISTAKTWDEMLTMIREALTVHIEFLIEDGDSVPESMMSIDDAIVYHSTELAKAAEPVAGTDATLRDCRPCRRGHSIRTSTRMLFSWSVTSTILPPTPSANPATSSCTSMALTPGAYWEPMRKPSSNS